MQFLLNSHRCSLDFLFFVFFTHFALAIFAKQYVDAAKRMCTQDNLKFHTCTYCIAALRLQRQAKVAMRCWDEQDDEDKKNYLQFRLTYILITWYWLALAKKSDNK